MLTNKAVGNFEMESRKADKSAVAGGDVVKSNGRFFNFLTFNNNGDVVSWKILYFLVFVTFVTQFVSFNYLYTRHRNLEIKYDVRLEELENRMKNHDVSLHRVKRDLEMKDNSIMKPATNEIKADITEAELVKNESNLTLDERIQFKHNNLSAEDWIWLNKYSRVPLKMMEEFCKATQDKCPPLKGDPGEKGDRGERGEKGDKGEDGSMGQRGATGSKGPLGPPGPRGEKGEKGNQGLDGRPSVPGEPGLDGIPGRNGKDGKQGQKGERGTNGIDGINGINGSDGEKGTKGEPGEKGEKGTEGLAGRRGQSGKPGLDGIPGRPGISAKNCSINGTNKFLVPPTIVGSEQEFPPKNVTVREGEHLKITCKASGTPEPRISWQRLDENENEVPIIQGQWGEINSGLETITFRNVSRRLMGEYRCIAENSIPPAANRTFTLNVNFPPYIGIQNLILNVTLNSTALLSCKIEAFPRGVYFWKTHNGDLLEESFGRFQVDYTHSGLYETELMLNITNVTEDDLGEYFCVAKNFQGQTEGRIIISNRTDSGKDIVPTKEVCNRQRITYFGDPPPETDGVLCPQCQKCKNCGFGYNDLEFKMLVNDSTIAFTRKRNCEMETIGKAVYHNVMFQKYGSWMKDSNVMDNSDVYWVTTGPQNNTLLEYANKAAFTTQAATKVYTLSDTIMGNDHVIYNRTFYYYTTKDNKATIVKYDLSKQSNSGAETLSLSYCDTSTENHLYETEYNTVDIMADDNGIWIICAVPNSNNTAVIKLNVTSFKVEYAWNISVKHQDIGDMFIICGVLYGVQNVIEINTRISFALDLYKSKLLDDQSIIPFTNPFRNTTMISYNNRLNELYTWDNGNMLTYPIKLRELNTDPTNGNETQSENPSTQNETLSKKNNF